MLFFFPINKILQLKIIIDKLIVHLTKYKKEKKKEKKIIKKGQIIQFKVFEFNDIGFQEILSF